jgi:hypothetical protein
MVVLKSFIRPRRRMAHTRLTCQPPPQNGLGLEPVERALYLVVIVVMVISGDGGGLALPIWPLNQLKGPYLWW